MNRFLSVKPFLLLLSLLSLLSPCVASAGEPVEPVESVEELAKQGDVYDQKLQPAAALRFYLPAEALNPKNVPLLLCIARQYRHLMADAATLEEKLRMGSLGKGYAERALALAPNESEAHLSIAIGYAKMVPLLGNRDKMEASRCVKAAVDKSIALDASKDLAWHVLGCWHQRLADLGMVKRTVAQLVYGKLPEATNDEAVKCFKKAIQLNPDRLIHYIELGRTYAQMGKASEARRYLAKGLAMPDVGKDDPETKRRGRETLAALK